jgi:uncharacterized protein YjiS (DUF1127 family)
MWASNDQSYGSIRAVQAPAQPIDSVDILAEARRMQAREAAKLLMAIGRGLRKIIATALAPYRVWHDYQSAFAELSALDDRMLADIGITRADIPRVAAGVWTPEIGTLARVKRDATVKPSANFNRPQVAA